MTRRFAPARFAAFQPGALRIPFLRAILARGGAAVLAALLVGCASTNPRDPLETYNRAMYSVNDAIDRNVVKPLAEGYRVVMPGVLRNGVRNFFANLDDIWIGANNLLQAKLGDALSDWMRVVLNSTFGIAGLYDVASDAGLPKHNEDFGQTLGWWGTPSGPYLVLPFFGPSTMRDGPAYIVDVYASPSGNLVRLANDDIETPLRWSVWALLVVSRRADALDATSLIEQAALDRYAFTRDAFLQRRRNLVYDGNPPRERESENDGRSVPPAPLSALGPASVD
jgi:phospholipid-binding lipoprotein MlaA